MTLKPLLGLGLLGLIGLGLYRASVPMLGECEDVVKNELQSEDGKHAATVIERNCGATTHYVTALSLRPGTAGRDPDDDQVVLLVRGRCELGLAWREGNLDVSYPASCEVVEQVEGWSGIRIRFKPAANGTEPTLRFHGD